MYIIVLLQPKFLESQISAQVPKPHNYKSAVMVPMYPLILVPMGLVHSVFLHLVWE